MDSAIYDLIDAPNHFIDFKNLASLDDDGADKWFDQHNEDGGFEDTFQPAPLASLVTPKVKRESEDLSQPREQLSEASRVREELCQVKREEERETFLISKPPGNGHSSQPSQKVIVKEEPGLPEQPVVTMEAKDAVVVEVNCDSVKKGAAGMSSCSKDNTKTIPKVKQSSFKRPKRAAAHKAVSCIHSILSPKIKRQTPNKATPRSGFKGQQPSADSAKEKLSDKKNTITSKTYEERQLEEMKRLQTLTRKRLRASRKSYARLAKTSGPVKIKGRAPTTETEEFHFHQTTREKRGLVLKGENQEGLAPQQFANSLRSSRSTDNFNPNTLSKSNKPPTPPGTKLKPFKFHLDQRLGHKAGDPPPSDGPIVPMAEFVNKYHKATPPRFRRTAKKPQQLNEGAAASLTVPRTPQLSTKTRTRLSIVKSAAVIEQEELDKIRQYEFKANPINRAVFEKSGLLGVPRKVPRPALIPPQTPELATKKRCLERQERAEPNEQNTTFHAHPMPDFTKVTGLPAKRELPITNPESPALTLKRRRLHDDHEEEEDRNDDTKKQQMEEGYKFTANPLPDFSKVFRPQHKERVLVAEPFSFEERDKDKPSRESIVDMILSKSKPAPFKAQGIPDFSGGPSVPPRRELPPTKPQPFTLQSEIRGQKHATKLQEKLEKEIAAHSATVFKASDATVLYETPFMPKQSSKPLTNPDNVVLFTEARREQRASFDEQLQQEAQRKEEEEIKRKALREIQEKKELVEYRKSLVHKAQPIKCYTGVVVAPSDKPVTTPISPVFHTDKRVR